MTGKSCWLYLCESREGPIVKSVLVYSPIQPVSWDALQSDASEGRAPVLTSKYASDRAVITKRKTDDFSFKWREDGKAVAIYFCDEIRAVVSIEEKYGSSTAIGKSGPFGDPLNLANYNWL